MNQPSQSLGGLSSVPTRIAFGVGIVAVVAQAALTIRDPFAVPWSVTLLLIAPLTIFPLILERLEDSYTAVTFRLARFLQFPSALLLLAALNLPGGVLATCLGVPWVTVCGLLAITGLVRAYRSRCWNAAERVIDVGLMFLGIAAF